MISEPAPAKINLALHVRARRPDGYHTIETLFAFCRDGDRVTLAEAERSSFSVTGPFADALAAEPDNLVTRAAAAFTKAFAVDRPFAVTLDKQLPVASGLGGGSADAAAMLRALARVYAVPAGDHRLASIAAALGADVPACLAGQTALGTGRGDRLERVAGCSGQPVLLVNPGVPVSTAAVFARWDGEDRGPIGSQGTLLERARAGRNDLTPAARDLAPAIGDVLERLAACDGALLTRLSGSGATCFALFKNPADCRTAAAGVRSWRPEYWCLETALA